MLVVHSSFLAIVYGSSYLRHCILNTMKRFFFVSFLYYSTVASKPFLLVFFLPVCLVESAAVRYLSWHKCMSGRLMKRCSIIPTPGEYPFKKPVAGMAMSKTTPILLRVYFFLASIWSVVLVSCYAWATVCRRPRARRTVSMQRVLVVLLMTQSGCIGSAISTKALYLETRLTFARTHFVVFKVFCFFVLSLHM